MMLLIFHQIVLYVLVVVTSFTTSSTCIGFTFSNVKYYYSHRHERHEQHLRHQLQRQRQRQRQRYNYEGRNRHQLLLLSQWRGGGDGKEDIMNVHHHHQQQRQQQQQHQQQQQQRRSSTKLSQTVEPVQKDGNDDEDDSGGDGVGGGNKSLQISSPFSRGKSYYLIWSKGFIKKFVLTIGLLVIVSKLPLNSSSINLSATFQTTMWFHDLALPIVSGSCCLLQLIINIMFGASGCIGFNTILGPIRPYLLALMLFTSTGTTSSWTFTTFSRIALRASLSLLPEIVHVWNTLFFPRLRRKKSSIVDQNSTGPPLSSSSSSSAVTGSSNIMEATMHVEIPGMGCVACINKIESSIQSISKSQSIIDAKIWIREDDGSGKCGCAILKFNVNSDKELNELTEEILHAIDNAGFSTPRTTKLESSLVK